MKQPRIRNYAQQFRKDGKTDCVQSGKQGALVQAFGTIRHAGRLDALPDKYFNQRRLGIPMPMGTNQQQFFWLRAISTLQACSIVTNVKRQISKKKTNKREVLPAFAATAYYQCSEVRINKA